MQKEERLHLQVSTFLVLYFHHSYLELHLFQTWKLWNEEKSIGIIDEMLGGTFSSNEVIRCIQVALLCVQHRTGDRPTMSAVVFMLSNENVELPQPNKPGFITESTSFRIHDSSFSGKNSNIDQATTMTTVEAR